MLRRNLLAALLACTPLANAAPPWPGDSVYQLTLPLTDQDGKAVALDQGQGHPVLVTMFYTSCQFVCPMLVDALRDTLAALTPAQRERIDVLMVSFDPERDTVQVLRRTADERGLDRAHWTLARSDAAGARKLAALLGIRFRALPDGDYNHTSTLVLLDARGRIAGGSSRLGSADPAFVKRIQAQLR
jgi:protein SCO1/2